MHAVIAQMMRVNLFRPVHVKTLTSQLQRVLLTARKLLQGKALAIENDIRGLLRNFGIKVGPVGAVGFDPRIRELVVGFPDLAELPRHCWRRDGSCASSSPSCIRSFWGLSATRGCVDA
jgi:transposase